MARDHTKDQLKEYVRWTDALLRSMEVSLQKEDPANQWKYGGYGQFARNYNQILFDAFPDSNFPPILDGFNLEKMPGINDTLAAQQKEHFEMVHANASIMKAYFESKLGLVEDETLALKDFLQARLRSAVFRTPEKEREIQEALE